MRVFGKRPVSCLVLVGVAWRSPRMILRLESGAVMSRSTGRGIERALVLELVERLDAGLRVDLLDLLAFFEEHAVHADVRADHDVVVDEVALADRPLDP